MITLSEAPLPFKGTEIHTLPNGLRLLIKEDHTVPVVSIQAWARCGAVNETPNIYGISHGLEHMVFKGTPTRTAEEVTQAIENQGGYINAATQLETTHYYIDVPSSGAKQALDVLGDTLLHPAFPQNELERERLVILEEIHSRDDSPDATLWDEFISKVFDGTPYAIKVIGNKKTVSSMSQQDLFAYFRAHYVPENKCVVVVGDFEKQAMLKQLESLFAKEKSGTAPKTPAVLLGESKFSHVVIKRPVQMSYIGIGRPVPGMDSPDLVALDVLADVLGGGASARFYQNIRENKQAVLSVSCDYTPFSQQGLFSFFAEALPEKGQEAIDAIQDELKDLDKNPIRTDELARAKARIKSEWLHGSETPRGQASTLGSLGVFRKEQLVNTYLSDIEKLTVDHLMAVYRAHLKNRPFHITQLVPND
jgi:zinc protease